MARKRNRKANAGRNDGERKLSLYERVAGHVASIAKSVALAVVSLTVVVSILVGWDPPSVPAVDIGLPFGASTPAKGEGSRPGSAKQSAPLFGDLNLYIRPRQVKICPR